MNANELANNLKNAKSISEIAKLVTEQVIPMLRANTLTDEEILDCMNCLPKYNSEIVDEDLIKFARAILRKAQNG